MDPVRPLPLLLALLVAATASAAPRRYLVLLDLEAPAPALAADAPRAARRSAWIQDAQRALREARAALPLQGLTEDAVEELWAIRALRVTADEPTRARLAAHPSVAAVLPDEPIEAPRLLPGTATKDELGPTTWGLAHMGVPEIWRRFGLRGEGVRVGVIDTGVDPEHPDLAGKVVAYRDFGAPGAPPHDMSGHGSHTAGTLVGGDASGVAIGVAPEAELVVGKGFGGPHGGAGALLAAMQWMLDPDGDPSTDDAPEVVSMSWHSGPGDQEPFFRAVDALVAADVVPCFSAGNFGPDGRVSNPKRYPASLSTGAVDHRDQVAEFSSRGPTRYQGRPLEKPDWTAPGVDVFSARPGGTWRYNNGTSMAAPHAAGLVALLRQARPDLTVARIADALRATARDHGTEGWDGDFGAGVLDGLAAVLAVARTGRVDLVLVDPEGNPVPGGRAQVLPGGSRFAADAFGVAGMQLPPGPTRLEVAGFGYPTREVAVEVVEGEARELRVKLTPAARFPARVAVRSDGGEPLAGASVTWLDTPLGATTTDADGLARAQLPPGRYLAQVEAPGRAPARVGLVVPGAPRVVTLRPRADVLLVDDDVGTRLEQYVVDAFELAGRRVDVWDRSHSALTTSTLSAYPQAVWMTGNESRDTFTSLDQELVQGYLAAGGQLLVTGQDIAYDMRRTDFLRRTLRTWYDRDNSRVWRVQGLDMDFHIDADEGAGNQSEPDEVNGMYGGSVILRYPSQYPQGAGVLYTRRTRVALLGFGLEAVTPASSRAELLVRLLAKLAGEDDGAAAAALRRRLAQRSRFQVRGR